MIDRSIFSWFLRLSNKPLLTGDLHFGRPSCWRNNSNFSRTGPSSRCLHKTCGFELYETVPGPFPAHTLTQLVTQLATRFACSNVQVRRCETLSLRKRLHWLPEQINRFQADYLANAVGIRLARCWEEPKESGHRPRVTALDVTDAIKKIQPSRGDHLRGWRCLRGGPERLRGKPL